jgi:hypothetical protein
MCTTKINANSNVNVEYVNMKVMSCDLTSSLPSSTSSTLVSSETRNCWKPRLDRNLDPKRSTSLVPVFKEKENGVCALQLGLWIRIKTGNPDPDPGRQKLL